MTTGTNGTDAKKKIVDYIDRVERLNEAKVDIRKDITDVFDEAKGEGFDVKALKEVIRRRKKDKTELDAFESMVELYEDTIA